MTVPHPLQQLGLFAAHWYEPIDPSSQVDRMPGTADAPCLCWPPHYTGAFCAWPFCGWKSTSKEDE